MVNWLHPKRRLLLLTSKLPIRGDRLLLALRWCGWAAWTERLSDNFHDNQTSRDGFGDLAQTRELVRRFDIRSLIFLSTLWSDVIDLMSTNPQMLGIEIDISGLLNRLAAGRRKPEELFGGFLKFLRAMACGELTEADLMKKATA